MVGSSFRTSCLRSQFLSRSNQHTRHQSQARARGGYSDNTNNKWKPRHSKESTERKSQFCRAVSEAPLANGQYISCVQDRLEFDSIDSALAEIAAGRFVVVLDNENRENEGDLIAAAERVTTENIAFMVNHTSGVICVGMLGEDLDRLQLPLMVPPLLNTEPKGTAFTVSVDLREGISTGISAQDRSRTIRALTSSDTTSEDLRRPGHVFPLRYAPGGVLTRRGHTEASVDLARLAGCHPSGVLCEIVNTHDGSMARSPELFEFAKQHRLKIITIESLVEYRMNHS